MGAACAARTLSSAPLVEPIRSGAPWAPLGRLSATLGRLRAHERRSRSARATEPPGRRSEHNRNEPHRNEYRDRNEHYAGEEVRESFSVLASVTGRTKYRSFGWPSDRHTGQRRDGVSYVGGLPWASSVGGRSRDRLEFCLKESAQSSDWQSLLRGAPQGHEDNRRLDFHPNAGVESSASEHTSSGGISRVASPDSEQEARKMVNFREFRATDFARMFTRDLWGRIFGRDSL